VSEDPTREDPTRGHGFDELARSLAEGSISRRRALKLFAGTALAALIPSRAMAITCPPGTVKICHIPQRADGTCRRGDSETRCVTPGSDAAIRHAGHPCDCCGGCGETNNCREPNPPTCFSTGSTTTTAAGTTTTTTTAAGTTTSTTTPAGTTTSTTTPAGTTTSTTTAACIPDRQKCVIGGAPCCSADRVCRANPPKSDVLRCRRRL
jgi:hypothetical protein